LVKLDKSSQVSPDDCFLQQLGKTSFSSSSKEVGTGSSQQLLVEAASTFALASAALDAHSLGIPLRGREKEQRRIANFLRLAIRSGNNGRSNCTMFCAGPVSSPALLCHVSILIYYFNVVSKLNFLVCSSLPQTTTVLVAWNW